MKADRIKDNALLRFLDLDLPRPLIVSYVVASVFLYTFIKTHTPLAVNTGAPHDDTLFMRLGWNLASGRWLGQYNEFTLLKGPGYPAFLAVGNWLGISVSMATALFHCLAVTLLVVICHRFVKSILLSGLMFTLLLWHPVSLSVYLLRILRDTIYYAQGILFLAFFIAALFSREDQKSAFDLCGVERGRSRLVLADA